MINRDLGFRDAFTVICNKCTTEIPPGVKVLNEFDTDAVLDEETGLVGERRPKQGSRRMAKCAFDVRS